MEAYLLNLTVELGTAHSHHKFFHVLGSGNAMPGKRVLAHLA